MARAGRRGTDWIGATGTVSVGDDSSASSSLISTSVIVDFTQYPTLTRIRGEISAVVDSPADHQLGPTRGTLRLGLLVVPALATMPDIEDADDLGLSRWLWTGVARAGYNAWWQFVVGDVDYVALMHRHPVNWVVDVRAQRKLHEDDQVLLVSATDGEGWSYTYLLRCLLKEQ